MSNQTSRALPDLRECEHMRPIVVVVGDASEPIGVELAIHGGDRPVLYRSCRRPECLVSLAGVVLALPGVNAAALRQASEALGVIASNEDGAAS